MTGIETGDQSDPWSLDTAGCDTKGWILSPESPRHR